MSLKADKERLRGQEQPDPGRSAAWRALWQRLLSVNRDEAPRRRNVAVAASAARRQPSSKREA